ncbi:protein kinase [bacterium]|nr:protein kinase [bacterium]
MIKQNAAEELEGRTLTTGWSVIKKIKKKEGNTGGCFSVCYKVKKKKEICFLKAFDFKSFMKISPEKEELDVLTDMLLAYRYEKQLSDLCKDNHVTNVIFVLEAGEEFLKEYDYPRVPYLLFNLADGDVRTLLQYSEDLDFTWRLKSLHDISIGLRQLHKIEVSHQDLKPSNVLVFKQNSKIGDLGRSLCRTLPSPYDNMAFSGDKTYAPPEILYKYYLPDWYERVFAADCYLLGSMVVFYFSGISMNALLGQFLPENFSWINFRVDYYEIKPYLIDAFYESIEKFGKTINDEYFRNELKWCVEKLCFPYPENRGYPENIIFPGNNYNLERFVSKFNMLYKKALWGLKNG